MQRPLVCLTLAGTLLAATFATTTRAVPREQIDALFRPFVAEQVVLAPDGRHVAYTEHVKEELRVIIMALEPPYAKVTLAVDDDHGLAFSKDKVRASLRFLGWATSNRLVFAPTEERVGLKTLAPIMAVDADGKNPRTLADSPDFSVMELVPPPPLPPSTSIATGSMLAGEQEFGRNTKIVGFMTGHRDQLLVQAVGGERTVGNSSVLAIVIRTTAYTIDVQSGKRTILAEDNFAGVAACDRLGRSRLGFFRRKIETEGTFKLLERGAPAFDASWLGPMGKHFTVSVENYFTERAYPLGFDVDPDILYVASNVGRDTFGVYAFNLKTKQRVDFALEHPNLDLAPLEPIYPSPSLIFDEYSGHLAGARSTGPHPVTVWHDPELAKTQAALDRKFPGRTVQILGWSEARTVYLLRVTGGTEPGRYFVFDKTQNLASDFLRRAPWLKAADLHATEHFEFDAPNGVHLSGYITTPDKPRIKPPPVLIAFADGIPGEPQAEFDREAQVLASMGFIVVRLNQQGVGGEGLKHRNAVLTGIDRLPAEDALATVEWLSHQRPIDRKRVVTFGHGFGGYLAVRAAQLYPDTFRCAVAVEAPLDPGVSYRGVIGVDAGMPIDFTTEANRTWLQRGPANLHALSALDRPDPPAAAICLMVGVTGSEAVVSTNLSLRNQVRRHGGVAEYIELGIGFGQGLPDARAKAYDQLEEFFNLNLYKYDVKIGPTKEVK